MTKETTKGLGAAILSAITVEGNASGKAQGLITEAIKAGDKPAFVAVATGLERVKDATKRKALFAILRTRMRRGCKAAETSQQWTVKRGKDGIYAVSLKDWPSGEADETAKLRKALDLVKAHISDPTVAVELMTAMQANVGAVTAQQHAEAAH
jgi:hypothetical protein